MEFIQEYQVRLAFWYYKADMIEGTNNDLSLLQCMIRCQSPCQDLVKTFCFLLC